MSDQFDQRMADEPHRHASLLVERLLEREDRQHPIDEPLHRLHAAGPPRPQLRADVIDHRHAEPLDGAHQAEIEIRVVNHDQRVRLASPRGFGQEPQHAPRARQHGQGFGEPGHRQAMKVGDQFGAGGLQPFTAETEHFEVGFTATQGGDQRAGVEIARRLAARDHETCHRGLAGARR